MSLSRYESFLVKHVSAISTVESSLRSLTWFLPGRFKDAELASEALSASLNVLSMYHDTLLAKYVLSDPKFRPLIPFSLHTRYTTAWSGKVHLYKWAARTLQLLRYTELVIEMGLRRKVSNKSKWRAILCLEIMKALLRFILLRETRRPILAPPIPERDIDPSAIPSPPQSPPISSSPIATPAHLQNNHVPLLPHPLISQPSNHPDNAIEDYLLSKALTPSSVKPSLALVKSISSPQEWIAEFLYILRPLVYVSLHIVDRPKSNRPFIAALAIELLSRLLRRNVPPSAVLERAEYARRDRDVLWYLFRGPVWTDFTRPKIEAMADKVGHTPILGLFGALVKDWIPLIDEYYYYTAP